MNTPSETGLSDPGAQPRYDLVTIILHWLTAILVVVLFGMTLWWSYAPREIGFRFELEDLHVSFGILLTAVVVGRVLWRVFAQRRLTPAGDGLQQHLAEAVHILLYALIAVQIGLGFALRGLQGADLSFFGLFTVPALLARSRDVAEVFAALHYWTGWAIIGLAGGHAAMALLHHYWLKDGVLRRMLPRHG